MPQQAQTFILIILMVVAFYFLIMRPQRKRQQAIQQTMRSLGPGTRVLLNSGIFATVLSVGDRQASVEIAPGVELTILKQAIARIATDADEDTDVLDDDEDELEETNEPVGIVDNDVRSSEFDTDRREFDPQRPTSDLDLPPAGTVAEADRDPNRPSSN